MERIINLIYLSKDYAGSKRLDLLEEATKLLIAEIKEEAENMGWMPNHIQEYLKEYTSFKD